MATEQGVKHKTYEASTDLSSKQFYFVKLNSSGQLAVAGDGDAAIGTLYNKPGAQGRAGQVATDGDVKVIAGGSITAGTKASSDTNGKAVTAGTGDTVLGEFTTGGASGDIVTVLLNKG